MWRVLVRLCVLLFSCVIKIKKFKKIKKLEKPKRIKKIEKDQKHGPLAI